MAKRIFVGNLPFSASEAEIRGLFEKHGAVLSCSLISDRATGRARGFGFVEMEQADADKAIKALEGMDLDGRKLRVSEARERREGGQGDHGRDMR